MSSQFHLAIIFYAFLACTVLHSLIKCKRSNSGKPRRLPPGPSRLPLLGNLHQLRDPLHVSFLELAKKHGDLMFLQVGYAPTLVISSADVAREIVKNHDVAISGKPVLHAATKLTYDNSSILFSTYGEYWREIKKIATLELLSAKRVQSFQAVRDDEVRLLLDSIARASGPVDVSELLHALSSNVMSRVAFGTKFHHTTQEMLCETQDLVGSICVSDFLPWMGWLNKVNGFDARLERNFNELDHFCDEIIQEHLDPKRPKPQQEDLVDVLLRLSKESKHNVTVSAKFMKAIMLDMYIGGTDTNSATLTWAMTELIRNPEVLRRAQEEVRNAVKGKNKVEESDVPQFTYLKSLVKETLRFHPPGPILARRETIEDSKIRGYDIPAKTRVFINGAALLMDPKSWEDPQEFRPERFVNNSIDFRGQHFEYIPFGVGRRMCPGANFALAVVELVLANLLYHFNWELPPGVTRENMNVDEALGITVLKKTPLYLVARPANV